MFGWGLFSLEFGQTIMLSSNKLAAVPERQASSRRTAFMSSPTTHKMWAVKNLDEALVLRFWSSAVMMDVSIIF